MNQITKNPRMPIRVGPFCSAGISRVRGIMWFPLKSGRNSPGNETQCFTPQGRGQMNWNTTISGEGLNEKRL